jgi:hypothetical protein
VLSLPYSYFLFKTYVSFCGAKLLKKSQFIMVYFQFICTFAAQKQHFTGYEAICVHVDFCFVMSGWQSTAGNEGV